MVQAIVYFLVFQGWYCKVSGAIEIEYAQVIQCVLSLQFPEILLILNVST